MQTEIEPTWITYEEAQRLTSLGRTMLWRICSSGEVKSAKVGRSVRLSKTSLEAFMERTAAKSSAG